MLSAAKIWTLAIVLLTLLSETIGRSVVGESVLWSRGSRFDSQSLRCQATILGKLLTPMCIAHLLPISIIWHRPRGDDARWLGR